MGKVEFHLGTRIYVPDDDSEQEEAGSKTRFLTDVSLAGGIAIGVGQVALITLAIAVVVVVRRWRESTQGH
jgi:hypothetical protein